MTDPMDQGTGEAAPRGLDAGRAARWFESHVDGARPPFEFSLMAGGRSNLTFLVTDSAGKRYVLRRPPTGHLLPRAHDMAREHRIISALGPAGVPVPTPLGLCEDLTVCGAPFYVMDFVEGVIARNEEEATTALDEGARHRAGFALVETLADIHDVDPDAVGLGDLGRREGYIARQLSRWHANYLAANESRGGTPLQAMEDLHDSLLGAIPPQGTATVVHGDFRLDNCVLAPGGTPVLAVLDWELCTLGDPLADLGQLLVYWPEPGEPAPLGQAASRAPGFARRDELVDRYAARTGRDLGDLGYYVAFAYWKLAAILEGVYARYTGGAMGEDGFDARAYENTVAFLTGRGLEAAGSITGEHP